MNGNKSTAGSIDQEGVKAKINELLASLQDLKESFVRCNRDADAEWRQISTTLNSVMEEIEKEKVGEPLSYLRPAGPHKGFSLGRGRPLKSMIEQRERIHVRERVSSREVIGNLIEGSIALAENFNSVINALCIERDQKVSELEARYQKLWDEYEELACDPSRQPRRLRVMMAGFKDKRWSGTFEGGSILEALDMATAKGKELYWGKQQDSISDDDFVSDDEEELCDSITVDRRSASVDRQDEEKWGDGLDEKFKGLWAWKPRPQLPAIVTSTAQVNRTPQEEEGRPRFGRFLRKDDTMEEVTITCMVTDCNRANIVKTMECLIDTGAQINLISQSEVERLGLECHEEDVGLVQLAGGSTVPVKAVAKNVNLGIGDTLVQVDLSIMPMDSDRDRTWEVILGTGFLRSVGAVVDFDLGRISFSKIDPDRFHYWRYTPGQRRH